MNKKEILDAYKWRFACKKFDADKKISDEDFNFLLEVIRLSPSSFGFQALQVYVIQNEKIKNELLPVVWGGQGQLPTASHVLLFAARKDIHYEDNHLAYMSRKVMNLPDEIIEIRAKLIKKFQEEDFKLLDDQRYLLDWAAKQVYIALGNLMSAAAEIGIDSCAMEGFDKNGASAILAKHGVIDPNEVDIAVFCALGYRLADPQQAKTRRPMNELVKFIK